MNHNIVYLSSFIPRTEKEAIASQMKNFNFNSADAFSYSLFSGFKENLGHHFQCITIPPLGAYPRYNKRAFYHGGLFKEDSIRVNSVGYSTFYIYQYYSIYANTLKCIRKNISPQNKNVLVVYSINIPVIKAAIEYRRQNAPDTKIVLIIPDLLEDSLEKSLASEIKKAIIGDMDNIYKEMDGFVLLSEPMNERLHTQKPYCIVEGLYNSSELRKIEKPTDGLKRIFYSGMLYEKFGVKNLIDAFLEIKDSDVRLQICGCGELESYIREKADIDKRITFLGLVPRNEALRLQSMATLLVNPRTPEGDFTKYSFPSKNIEYLVSGTPTLIYELEGIPSEYYNYCYHLGKNELGIQALKSKIEDILKKDAIELDQMAKNAALFIKNNKNAKAQTKKIIDLIDKI